MIPVRLIATGKAVPSHSVTSASLDLKLGHPAGYTLRKSGVLSRFVAAPDESQSQLGAAALLDALKNASLRPADIDLLICACGVPEQALPNTACFVAEHAGLPPGTQSFDVNASCLSFMAAFRVAASMLAGGAYRRIAIVSSDLASRGVDWSEPEASMIFGDGAAAVIVERGDGSAGIRAYKMGTYPEGRRYCEIRGGGTERNPRNGCEPGDYLFRMDGKAVFRLAVKVMPDFLVELMAESGAGLDKIDVVVPHQASPLGLAHAARILDVPDAKIIKIFETHGNQVAASLPTALHEAVMTGRAVAGQRLLMMGTAAGLTIGGMILDL